MTMIVSTVRKRSIGESRLRGERVEVMEGNVGLPSSFTTGWPTWLVQAVKYAMVGLLNTGLDAALYLGITHWLGLGGLRVLAKSISYGAGILNSFYWNRSWTFRSRAKVAATLIPFVLASLTALGINAGAMYLSLGLFGQREAPAFVLATGVTLLWNFGATKFVVFRG
jgi:putative flippase GtrA